MTNEELRQLRQERVFAAIRKDYQWFQAKLKLCLEQGLVRQITSFSVLYFMFRSSYSSISAT